MSTISRIIFIAGVALLFAPSYLAKIIGCAFVSIGLSEYFVQRDKK